MVSIFIDYTKWHYTYALVNIFTLTKEFVRFFLNLFSVRLFLASLFTPIFSVPVNSIESSMVSDMLAEVIGGMVARLIGALFRSALILLGIFCSILSVLFFTVVCAMWISMPLIIALVVYCIYLLIPTII